MSISVRLYIYQLVLGLHQQHQPTPKNSTFSLLYVVKSCGLGVRCRVGEATYTDTDTDIKTNGMFFFSSSQFVNKSIEKKFNYSDGHDRYSGSEDFRIYPTCELFES